ncbi:hypothetical protein H6G41_22240 [Tolypothrix sp. FACHB-123]|uniref:hypothetical protein n=1 Tax=Tolypothrix sp. FACHB-123 TaxID=2692868 RepID=UPI001682F7A4|nr:hypothetical protein [Tolypothrix sp. FACHB-123]MBD2357305.1 hypothetical protein [Tolypothrix sp. FACHB-123]
MNHFNLKSLTFYGVAIGSVLLLFKTVSVYGETNLKAPPAMSDRYRLVLAEDIPNCMKPEALILNIQQSGIYLNASFYPAYLDAESANMQTSNNSLSGIFSNPQLSLSGKLDRAILCNPTAQENTRIHSAKMQMQLSNQGNLIGQLFLSGSTRNFKFTAVPIQKRVKSQPKKGH